MDRAVVGCRSSHTEISLVRRKISHTSLLVGWRWIRWRKPCGSALWSCRSTQQGSPVLERFWRPNLRLLLRAWIFAVQRSKTEAIGVKAPLPGFVEPALASAIAKVPSGERWVHELKFDG
jgi:hypothetical protein